MKVLVLGGSGGMGRFASSAVSSIDGIDSITIADIKETAASDYAKSFNDDRITGIGLNVLDKDSLRKVTASTDVVLNLTGPFFKLAYPILEIALEQNCHYLDICDDWEPTEKMFSLNKLAEEKNKIAILGLGASPGITNMLALKAMNELDKVSNVYTGWDISGAKPEEESSQTGANAAMEHGIEQMIGQVKVYMNKKFKMVRPLTTVNVQYPQLGKFNASIFGHPEAITFPHHYPDISTSLNLMHGNELVNVFVFKMIRFFIEIKLLSKSQAAKLLERLERNKVSKHKDNLNSLPEVYGLAQGLKNETETIVAVTLDGFEENMSMGAATGYPLACGLKMLLEKKIAKFGVLAPEACGLDPDNFFDELSGFLGDGAQIKTIVTQETVN